MSATDGGGIATQPRLVSLSRAEAETGLKVWFLRRHIRTGALPFVKVGTWYYVDRADLDALIDRLKNEAAQ